MEKIGQILKGEDGYLLLILTRPHNDNCNGPTRDEPTDIDGACMFDVIIVVTCIIDTIYLIYHVKYDTV